MNKNIPKCGDLLISEPFLSDPNFKRSVILLCEYSEFGGFGLVLNHPSTHALNEVINEVYTDFPVFIGGPVEQNTLHYVHRLGDVIEDSIELVDGLYWSGDFETLKTLMNIGKVKQDDVRFFLGYSGWGAGQLKSEIDQNTWYVSSETTPELIFENDPEQFWRTVLKQMGGDYKVIANYPTDPRLN